MTTLLKIVRIVLVAGVLLFSLAILAGIGLYHYFSKDLPKLDSLHDYNPPVVSEVFDNNGIKIGEFWNEKRIVLSPQELPKTIVQAIVASEDDRFFEHKGIDYQGILRAFIENLKAGHTVQGGSTITQQVVKSLLLTSEKKLSRKVKEAILATRLEKNFNKDEILYLYLNQTFFGNRAYGIEAAAQNYFHKSAKELDIAEAAMIAGLAKAPSLYAPTNNPSMARDRQHYVINRMYEVGYITQEQMKKALDETLKIYVAGTDKEFNYRFAPWFTEYIRRMVQEKYGEQVPYTHGLHIDTTLDLSMQKAADLAVEKGLREVDRRLGFVAPIRTITPEGLDEYIKTNHIKIVKETFDRETNGEYNILSNNEITKLATPIRPNQYYEAVITAVNHGELTIKVGNVSGLILASDSSWSNRKNPNRKDVKKGPLAVGDVIEVKLKDKSTSTNPSNTTSLFTLEQKPLLESALFSYEPQTGFVKAIYGGNDFKKSEFNRAMQALRQTGSSIKPLIYAAALDKGYTPASIIEDSPLYYEYAPGRFWSPQNYGGGFKGPTTFRSGLVNSRNIVTVRILMDVGLDYTDAYARKLGISTPIQRYYAMALGSNDMKLYELCRAYGTFVTGGIRPDLVYIKKISDRFGKVLEEHQPRTIIPFTEQLKTLAKKDSSKLRDDLSSDGHTWEDKDQLKLTEVEKQILYGNYIPEGYTISPKTAYTMVSLMNDVVNFGTGYKVKELGRPAAGKTGTTNDETDVWFVGFTPNLFAGVWVGYDQVQKIGGAETGGKVAAPIFLYYMQQVLKDKPIAKFDIPKEINSEALNAPLDSSEGDSEAGGVNTPSSSGNADFIIQDF